MRLPPTILRRLSIFTTYSVAAAASYSLSFLLMYNGSIPPHAVSIMVWTLPWIVGIRLLTFIPFKMYQGLWRYSSIWDIRNLVMAAVTGALIFAGLIYQWFELTSYRASVIVIDTISLVVILGIVRLGRRILYESTDTSPGKRVLIVGAGDAGEMIVRDMRNNPYYDYRPIGFVDDDPTKRGASIHGVRVLGSLREVGTILKANPADEVLVAIPSAEPATIREILTALQPFKIPIKTLPNLRDILRGRVTVNQIRSLQMDDLLSRKKLNLEDAAVRRYVKGKRVLVTGAGGSIGSELCRQLMAYEPDQLILLDQYENNLFFLLNELRLRGSRPVHGVIADITDRLRVQEVFTTHAPQIIFHAAAHKHVPLMEDSPFEAIKNNIYGTWTVIEAAREVRAESFVLISTDKAVQPRSFMGVSKAVAELLVRALNDGSPTRLVAVRFGNVLGSQGSAVPVFMEQIRNGGPVTITHPEMKRYFMLIPEAAQLVLQAASIGRGGDLMALEMGDQIKVIEMARNLIRLSGFVPDKEIKIEITGLRPGEKLVEELHDPDIEGTAGTENPHVMVLHTQRDVSRADLLRWLGEMGALLASPNRTVAEAAAKLKEILPQFEPELSVARQLLERKFNSDGDR